jgi:hypothetical protein
MYIMRSIILFLIFLNIGVIQAAESVKPQDDVVNQLYTQIIKRHPIGIPQGVDKTAIWPFLSNKLIKILETGQACEDDYFRMHTNKDSKPEFEWLEIGLFSGDVEMAVPAKVAIERTERQKDGSYIVYVQFTYKATAQPYDKEQNPNLSFNWHGAVIVASEGGKFVIDDILLFKENSTKIYYRLSKVFHECDGPRWVGEK